MDVSRIFLKTANSLLSAVIVLFLVVAGAYSAYALWDNMQVYASVDDIQSQLLKYKPTPGEDNGPTFEELRAINPDVCAWITLDGTKIDYPVLQGEDNLTYINKDVYGNFALAGSIFLDSNCDRSFQEKYSLLYGLIWQNIKCLVILIYTKSRNFLIRTRQELLSCLIVLINLKFLHALKLLRMRITFSFLKNGRKAQTVC